MVRQASPWNAPKRYISAFLTDHAPRIEKTGKLYVARPHSSVISSPHLPVQKLHRQLAEAHQVGTLATERTGLRGVLRIWH